METYTISCVEVPIPDRKENIRISNRNRAIPERAIAKANGHPRYEGRKACIRGHGFTKYTSTGTCVECTRLVTLRNKNKNPEYTKAQAKKNWIWNTYKLTMDEYNAMIISQNNQCAICEKSLDLGIHVDHCHTSGKVRALLCPACNKGIGHFLNNHDILIKAAKYCKDHECT